MKINTNMSALFTARQENVNSNSIQKSMEKLSSGLSINRASDDSSGLAVSEKMRAQIRGLNRASKNVGDMVSFTSTAEGYLDEMGNIIQRIRELSVQAGNGIYSAEDRIQLNVEVSQLVSEIDRIASTASFNGMNIFSGRFAKEGGEEIAFHIGANADERISMNIEKMTAESLGLKNNSENSISLETQDTANTAISTLDNALKTINSQRANIGAMTNRAEMAQNGIDVASENLQASESRIRDIDTAKAFVDYAKDEILQSSSSAMLAQAININRASVARLFGSI